MPRPEDVRKYRTQDIKVVECLPPLFLPQGCPRVWVVDRKVC